jgi:hypothetical protein
MTRKLMIRIICFICAGRPKQSNKMAHAGNG